MNTTKHTPGPWRVDKTENLLRIRRDGDFATDIYAGKGKQSQCVGDFIQASTRNVVEAKGNARLIAMAPELLSELERITEKFCCCESEVTLEDFDACKQVIAKAKGQSHE